MKKILLGLILLGSFTTITAQISTSTGGASNILPNSPTTNTNVGIGTANPSTTLEVNGDIKSQTGYFYKSLSNNNTFSSFADRNVKCQVLSAGALTNGTYQTKTFNFFDFPTSNYNAYAEVFLTITDRTNKDRFSFNAEVGNMTMLRIYDKNEQEIFKIVEDGQDNTKVLLDKPNSFLGIGTSTFVDGADTYKLSVNGAIRAHRVKVYTTWADYVFEKDYKLPTLQEVEKHIIENGHLKDIPSAKEVEEKGIELGEMNKLLLQKVEELTLYLIEMNKELQEVKSQLNKG